RISRVATLLISTEARAWSMYEVAFAARPLLSDGEKKVLIFVWGNCSRPRSMRERELPRREIGLARGVRGPEPCSSVRFMSPQTRERSPGPGSDWRTALYQLFHQVVRPA